jgi:murein DD-endopeptidase MepM/ murein hydrolase activator NlpD
MSPYAMIYTLYRDVFGAAGGVETNWLGADATNADAVSSQTGESLFTLSILYWQKRFSTTVSNLRMFGASGQVYNAAQAAFIAKMSVEEAKDLAKYYASPEAQNGAKDPGNAYARVARAVGFDPFSLYTTGGGSSSPTDALGTNVAALQSYTSDISKWGQINLLETEYLTKLEIANEITKETGFEFYQDVDGDVVFKPPFYNMDTSGLRVYRIEPEDVISFDVQEKEPDCTVIKWTGGHFSDLKVPTLEGEFGKRAEFIDYRLVAQFGWRQETFDTVYYADERSAYYAAIGKMDVYNIAVRSASVSIPVRPELRPGYPVYIVHLDCFYYITGISHTVTFGSSCTSNLTLVGRRAKFHAPGIPPSDGRQSTVSDIRMDNMHLPPLPLTLPAGAVSAGSPDGYSSGDPTAPDVPVPYVNTYRKTQGFPNVVMAIDPQLVNPLQFARGFDLESLSTTDGIRQLILAVVMGSSGVLQRARNDTATTDEKTKSFDGPWEIQMGNSEWSPLPSASELASVARRLRDAGVDVGASGAADAAEAAFGVLVRAARTVYEKAFPGSGGTAAALELVSDYKSTFSVGKTLPGYYRYYSSAHPDPANQGMLRLGGGLHATRKPATQFTLDGTALTERTVTAGIPIATPGGGSVVRATHEIRSFDIARLEVAVSRGRVVQRGDRVQAYPQRDLYDALQAYFVAQILDADNLTDVTGVDDFVPVFEAERDRIAGILAKPDSVPPPPDVPDTVSPTAPSGTRLFSLDVLENGTTTEFITSFFTTDDRRVEYPDGTVQDRPHRGVDLRAPLGTSVLAAAAGTVSVRVNNSPGPRQAGAASGYGNWVEITHAGGFSTRYAHLGSVSVNKNQPVSAGELIGLSGNSGTTAAHLHFELRLNGTPVDPTRYAVSGDTFVAVSAPPAPPPAPVATPSGTPPVSVGVATFNQDYSEAVRAATFPAGFDTVGGVPGNDLNSRVTTLAGLMADAIAGPAAEAMQRVAASGSSRDAGTYAAAWAEMVPDGYALRPIVRSPTGRVVQNDAVQPYYAPVYPVSDERGYEVVGTYPYGRGFSLSDTTAFGQLFGPTGSLPDHAAVEAFVQRLLSTDGSTAAVAKILGESNLDATTKAEIAAGMDPALLSDKTIADALNGVPPGKTGAGANTPASSAQGIGVFSPVNVAYGLADMKVANAAVCDCFAHQADIQLLRDPTGSGEYIVLEGTEDAFAAYIRDVANTTVPGWAAAQDNYRGYVVAVGDGRTVGDAVNDVRRAFEDPLGSSRVGAALSEFDAAAAAVADARQAARSIDPQDGVVDPDAGFTADVRPAWEVLKTKFTKGQS